MSEDLAGKWEDVFKEEAKTIQAPIDLTRARAMSDMVRSKVAALDSRQQMRNADLAPITADRGAKAIAKLPQCVESTVSMDPSRVE
ncbi:MAG: hypothetical protein Q9157_003681 [Trypethelium eluteriae]